MKPMVSRAESPAVLHDSAGGATELAFLGPDGDRILGATHLPAGPPVGGVVICSAFGAEFLKNNRREVMLSRALTELGLAVQRFHYRGTGSSDRAIDFATFPTMCEDAARAADHLRRRAGVDDLTLVGTRLGGLVAAQASAERAWPLVLWEPATQGHKYFRSVLRSLMMFRVRQEAGGPPPTRDQLLEQCRSDGYVDVMGFSLTWPLYESLGSATLAGVIGPAPRPLLLLQIGRRADLSREYAALLSDLADQGFEVEGVPVERDEVWWFQDEVFLAEEQRELGQLLIDRTRGWFEGRLA